jgi:hypothetical protein
MYPIEPSGWLADNNRRRVHCGVISGTIEFWRRIAVGASFGTGSDSVVFSIGENDNPESSRGKQVLGKGALVIAYILFTIAAAVLGLVLLSVITTGPLPPAFESVVQ